jgi:putative ABC transport system permease protein
VSAARESLFRVWLDDAVHAARALLATPRYSIPAFISLALGIGASTAVFAIFSAVVLRPLPFPREDELVRIRAIYGAADEPDGASISYPDYEDAKAMSSLFSSVSAWVESNVTVTGIGDARHAEGASVTPEFFDTLETRAESGRTFTAAGPSPDAADVVVLSHSYWRTAFGGADVVGQKIVLNGEPRTIVGVVADDGALPAARDLWTPIRVSAEMKTARTMGLLRGVGRLKAGTSFEIARERLHAATKARNLHGDDGTLMYATFMSLRESLLGDKRTSALLMLTAVSAFLLLACANVAALLVTRASVRARELAVRAALGAGSSELARHAGLEALALALVSGAAGLAMSAGLVGAANRFYASELEYAPAHLDARVLVAFAALGLVSTLAIGIAPTLYALRIRPMDSLRADGRSSSSLGARRLREALVATQVAITLALVVSASVLVRSVRQLHAVSPGVDTSVVVGHVSMPPSQRKDETLRTAFARGLRERAEHAPGVTAAAIATDAPFDDVALSMTTENGPGAVRNNADSLVHFVSPKYFEVLAIPFLAGRPFTEGDEATGARVAAVSRAFAVQYLGVQNAAAIGQRFSFGEREGDLPDGAKRWYQIVAVVDDVLDGVVTAPVAPTIYLPFTTSNPFGPGVTVLVRGPLEPAALIDTVGRIARDTDKEATVFGVGVLGDLIERSYRGRTALEQLLSLFAFASLVLAAIGLFGVTSYAVAERSGEIGIRRALGASRGDIVLMVLRETGIIVVLGIVGGVACALGTRTLLASFLYGVVGSDLATYASVCVGILALSMLAALAPARSAASVTPSRALEVR